MKIGDANIQNVFYRASQTDKAQKNTSNAVAKTGETTFEEVLSKSASFLGDVKAINEAAVGIQLSENSLQKISGEKVEEAVRDLRNMTMNLKALLSKSLQTGNENASEYTVEKLTSKLAGTNPAQFHDFDYLATKSTSLLA